MNYKYNVTFKCDGKSEKINFKGESKLIRYLDKNKHKLNKMDRVVINFASVSLPLKMTVWNS